MTAELKPIRTAAEAGLVEAFAALRPRLAGTAAAARREAAFRRFEAAGLPHRRIEEWKYTDLRALMRDAKPLAPPPDAATKARAQDAGRVLAGVAARRIVFVDGMMVPELSDLTPEPGLTVSSLGEALGSGNPAVLARLGAGPAEGDIAYALNTAFMGDGAVIEVAPGASISRPVHLAFVYGSERAAAVFSRSLVVVGEGAGLTLIESHEGPDGVDYQVNAALDLAVGERAEVEHIKVNMEGSGALHISTLNATIGAKARFSEIAFLTGGHVVRSQLFVRCAGAGATLSLNGASLLKGRQHGDTALFVDHAAGGCRSRELFKSVLDGASRGVFQGKIIVRPLAQKTDARMMTRALLLSEDAEADNKPELEIFADDVQCGHGATSGALDDNLKFYLMARGIPEKDAEALLIRSFVAEAIEAGIREGGRQDVDPALHDDIHDVLIEATGRWLEARE
jgi:Fe-S cluster assembly protein SufD